VKAGEGGMKAEEFALSTNKFPGCKGFNLYKINEKFWRRNVKQNASSLIVVFLIASSLKKGYTDIINEPFCSYTFRAVLLKGVITL
jgi:hypothetical protein